MLPLHHSSNIRSKATAKINKKSQKPTPGCKIGRDKTGPLPDFSYLCFSYPVNKRKRYDSDNDSALRGGLSVHRAGAQNQDRQ
uniref:hypothetical protein n=1 Tax=Alistipes shahii TaxID=328814 RepID=UPI003FF00BD2